MNETYENGFCPFIQHECNEGCALWSIDFESCAFLLMGEEMKKLVEKEVESDD